MKAKHTPGPWTFTIWAQNKEQRKQIEAAGLKPTKFITNDGGVVVMSDTGRVCTVDAKSNFKRGQGYQLDCPERDANAVLVAAAPELLALLEELIDIEGPCPGTATWATKVRAAIAKAQDMNMEGK